MYIHLILHEEERMPKTRDILDLIAKSVKESRSVGYTVDDVDYHRCCILISRREDEDKSKV